MKIEEERKRFEEWIYNSFRESIERFMDVRNTPKDIVGEYVSCRTQIAWEAWQEALPVKIKTVRKKI